MDNVIRLLMVWGACLAPVAVVVLLIRRKRNAWRRRSKVPFEELRRRPAGESLRLKLEVFEEKVNERAVMLALGPVWIAYLGVYERASGVAFLVGGFVVSAAWAGIVGWSLYRVTRERANYQLGFDGERFVGEELNRLVAQGFEVFHDLPFDGFNMDHVVVGQSGVFLVETKARRKPVKNSGRKEYRVEFDGNRLHWPMGGDEHGVQQAVNNARTLSQWLSKAVGELVEVTPILTLPGWLVDRKAPSRGVCVVNPKEIIKVCDTKEKRLSENLLKRICYQIEERCKLEMD